MLLFLFCYRPTLYHSQLTAVKMRFLLSSISGCNVGSGSQAIHHFRNEKEAGAVTWDRENKLVNSASSRLVFTSDGVGVGVVSGVVSATELESEESERFHFLPTPLMTPSLTFRIWSSENQIVGVGSRSVRVNQSQCTFPRFVIGLVLLLLLPTLTIWFSLDHKRNVSNGVVSGIGTLFSLDHKLYPSDYDYDSDSIASENQPLETLTVLEFFVKANSAQGSFLFLKGESRLPILEGFLLTIV